MSDFKVIRGGVCGNCKFSRMPPHGLSTEHGADARICKRYPPQVTSFLAQGPDGKTGAACIANWPTVNAHDDCGEYVLKLELQS